MAKGILDQYVRSHDEELDFAEEEAVAQAAIVIAQCLERCGMSQRELAQRLGISEGRISQILSAESNPTVKTLARVGRALGCRLQLDLVSLHRSQEPASVPGDQAEELWSGKVIPFTWQRREEDSEIEEMEAHYAVA